MCAASALIEMPAECGGTTARNGQQHFDMPPANPLTVSLDESSSGCADEIGNLQQRRGHWGHLLSNRDPHLYQSRLAITAPLVTRSVRRTGGYVLTALPVTCGP